MNPKQVKDLRKRLGLSQVDLARCLNISRESISRWENGEAVGHGVNLEVLQGISDAVKLGDGIWIGKRLRSGLAAIVARGLKAP